MYETRHTPTDLARIDLAGREVGEVVVEDDSGGFYTQQDSFAVLASGTISSQAESKAKRVVDEFPMKLYQ
jgi:hypothetical protein